MTGYARLHISIAGRVQGVGYRYTAAHEAQRLGLCGWIRNCRDGRVEAVVEGPSTDVQAFTEWCKMGPPGARVNEIQTHDDPGTETLPTFEIRQTR